MMRRREFIAGLGGVAAWPLAARAQQLALPVIGFFDWGVPRPNAPFMDAFRRGLAEAGYRVVTISEMRTAQGAVVDGHNVTIEYRWAYGQYDRFPVLAAELVDRRVAVIIASGSLGTARAAKAATATIPIVLAVGGDPVKFGLAASLSRPGGNVTGITFISTDLVTKRLDLLRKMTPQATKIAYLSGGPLSLAFEDEEPSIVSAASALGVQITVVEARRESDIEAAFETLVQREAGALVVGTVPHFTVNSRKIVALAARNKIPAIYPFPNYAFGGGLMTYGAETNDAFRKVGFDYVGPILKGAKPADLPIQQPTKFELIINLKTARALGLEVPPTLLAIADTVIE